MSDEFSADVLICGAGAAGLTLAIDLARRGITFRLIDRLDQPFRGSRGKAIQPRTQEIFEDLGFIDRIAAAGGAYPPERRYRDDGSVSEANVMEASERAPDEPYHMPLMVPQFRTEAAMRERMAELGQQPEFGCDLVGFEQDAKGVTARVVCAGVESTLRVRWLVGADGGRSFVRAALDIPFPGKTLGVRAVVADVILTGLNRDFWHRFGDGDTGRQISICPLAGTEMFQIQAPVALEGDVDLSAEGLQAMVAQRSGREDIRIETVSWASAYNMNARLAERYRVGRVFLVGDAAHIHPPTGGQGLNTSVQDAYNLGWKLAAVAQGASDQLLDSYEEERRPIAEEMLGLATKLLDATRRGEMRRGREVRQLDIGYRGSLLALKPSARESGPAAGDRAPDAPLLGAAGHAKRLFDLFRGPHWTLLGYEPAHWAVSPHRGLRVHHLGPRGELIDNEGHFRNAYAAKAGDWVLVRPDGYIAAFFSDGDPEMQHCLETFGLAPAVGDPLPD